MSINVFRGPFNYVWSGLDDLGLRACAQIIQDGNSYRVASKDDFANISITGANISIGSVGLTGSNGAPAAVVSLGSVNGLATSGRVEGIRAVGTSGASLPQPILPGMVITTGVSGTYTNGTLQNNQGDQYGNVWVSLGTALSYLVDSIGVQLFTSGNTSGNALVVDSQGRITTVQSQTRYGITGANGVAMAIDSLGRTTTLLSDPRFGISGSGNNHIASVDSEGRLKTLTSLTPVASGGLSTFRNLDLNQTGFSIKGAPGQIYGWFITNRSASERFVKLYDTTGVPNVGVMTPIDTLVFPGSTAANVAFPNGITFVSGIGIAATTAIGDLTSGAPTLNDVVVNIFYK